MADDTGHRNYEWDVAISLRDEDLEFARKIHAGLKDRFKVFLYSEEEKAIQFRNGVETLAPIYRSNSRAVIILWRPEWGESKWTRLERDTLSDRVVNETADFVLLVKLVSGRTPDWIPSHYIYRLQERWELGTLVEVIAGKINQLGGEVRVLTPIELAKQHKAARDWRATKQSILNSQLAADARERERVLLQVTISNYIAEIAPTVDGRAMEFEVRPRQFGVIKIPCSVRVTEIDNFQDGESPRRISVEEWDGVVSLYGERNNRIAPTMQRKQEYMIDTNQQGEWFWRNAKTKDVIMTPNLADEIMNRLLVRTDKLDRGELKRKRPQSTDPLDDDDNFHSWHHF